MFLFCFNILKFGNLISLFIGVKIAKSVIFIAAAIRFSNVSFLNFTSGFNTYANFVSDFNIPKLFDAPIPLFSLINTSILSYFNSNDFLRL